MDDDQILMKGGTEEDIEKYAKQNGADLTKEDVENDIQIEEVNILGMPLQRWKYKSCIANIAVDTNEKWATIYDIMSLDQGKGHATHLLEVAKIQFESRGFKFGGSVALNERMANIYKKLGIEEYKDENSF